MRLYEEALRDAGVQTCNLVKVSSILPPGCERIPFEEGLKLIPPGQITFAILAESETNEPGQIRTAGLGIADPKEGRYTLRIIIQETNSAVFKNVYVFILPCFIKQFRRITVKQFAVENCAELLQVDGIGNLV